MSAKIGAIAAFDEIVIKLREPPVASVDAREIADQLRALADTVWAGRDEQVRGGTSMAMTTSGSSCATTGCRAACSPPTPTSSTTAAPRGTASSTSLGSACPSASGTGPMHPMHDNQRGLVLV